MPILLKFRLLPERFTIHRMAPGHAIDPAVFAAASWISLTRTDDELSIVAPESFDFGAARRQVGWSCLKIDQTLDFSLTGVLAEVAAVLAEARVSIFAVSTYDTDYILCRSVDAEVAVRALRGAGHDVRLPDDDRTTGVQPSGGSAPVP